MADVEAGIGGPTVYWKCIRRSVIDTRAEWLPVAGIMGVDRESNASASTCESALLQQVRRMAEILEEEACKMELQQIGLTGFANKTVAQAFISEKAAPTTKVGAPLPNG